MVPLEGLEPPTLSLGRNCSSIELQRLTARVYRAEAEEQRGREGRIRRVAGPGRAPNRRG